MTYGSNVEQLMSYETILWKSCYQGGVIGCGFCRYDITTADIDNL